jgi:glycosyltransferase 2 family protein
MEPQGAKSDTDGARARFRRRLSTFLKLLISAALVAALFHYDVITLSALGTTFRDWPVALSALGALLVGYVLSAWRWYILLHAIGIRIRFRPCAEIFAMGTFANTFLPGGTGGDVVRAVYIARHVHSDRAGGVISVLADRAMGFLGVLLVAVLLGLAAAEHVIESPLTRTLYFLLVAGFAGITLGLIIVLLVLPPTRVAKISSLIGNRTMLHRGLLRIFQVIGQFRKNPAAVLLSIVLSVLTTLSIVIAVILLASGFKAGGLNALDFANATVFALVANIVPITPGGIGVAEGVFAFLCYAWETTPTTLAYGTIFLGQRLIVMVISLVGSIAFVTYKGSIGTGEVSGNGGPAPAAPAP